MAAFAGCVADGTSQGYVSVQSGPRYDARNDSVFGPQDDYVYYPEYQTYYGRRSHRYYYQDGSSWVGRNEPRVNANVILSAPSVQLDFHDSPARHHSQVVQKYPKQWSKDHRNDRRDDHQDNRR
ncbi:MAG: hypothetical protein JWM32_7 [Verrucomicrobia bacterium]|nr:hypothetical protein [Verrucomicrobiota bacterium]